MREAGSLPKKGGERMAAQGLASGNEPAVAATAFYGA